MNIKKGLRVLEKDERDFNLGAIFGVEPNIPDDFEIEPFVIYNQRSSDMCASCASGGAGSIMDEHELFYPWAFAVAVQNNPDDWGTNLRAIAKVYVKYGCPAFADMPRNILEAYERQDFDFLRRIENYPEYLYYKALANKKQSYMFIRPFMMNTYFDIIRSTIWKFRKDKKTIMLGLLWNWNPSDYVLEDNHFTGFGHAILCNGFTKNSARLVNSYGKEAGKSGKHLISKEQINRHCKRYGAVVFTDMSSEKIKLLLANLKTKQINIMQKTLDRLLQQVLLIAQELKRKTKANIPFYEFAKTKLGKDIAPFQNELGCMEAVNTLVKEFTGEPIDGGASTYLGYLALKKDKRFIQVRNPEIGDIIISPSGFGNGKIKHGHIGIISNDRKIMSNNSHTGLFDEHWNQSRWEWRYKEVGGFPTYYYRLITK